jgi:hypothetical protein
LQVSPFCVCTSGCKYRNLNAILHLLHKSFWHGQSEAAYFILIIIKKQKKHWTFWRSMCVFFCAKICAKYSLKLQTPIFTIVGRVLLVTVDKKTCYWWWCIAGGRIFLGVILLLSHLLCLYHDVCVGTTTPPLCSSSSSFFFFLLIMSA